MILVLLAMSVAQIPTELVGANDEPAGRSPERVAVLVGANDAPAGRKELRYSHADVRAVAAVLTELGGFDAAQVFALYDPDPAEVLQVLDTQLERLGGRESLLVFYYSGHADAAALYPAGEALALEALRERLDHEAASVRVGVIDACRGGGWTAVKGLVPDEVFEVNLPMDLSNEGSALIASSSGMEDAHESSDIGGSYFTHHWVGALRGAGDRDQNGAITLTEAFDHAKALTIRDTALVAKTPQHPSFRLNLRGRGDLALTRVDRGRSLIALEVEGPLEVVSLETGLVILEVPAGSRGLRLAVMPGRYVVRRRVDGETVAREVSVESGEMARVDSLEVVGTEALATKGESPLHPAMRTTLRDGDMQIALALGVRHQDSPSSRGFELSPGRNIAVGGEWLYGITDRLVWIVPSLGFGYRLGDPSDDLEWVIWGGLLGWGAGFSSVEPFILTGTIGLGGDMRWWLTSRSSVNVTVGLISGFAKSWGDLASADPPTTWRLSTLIGYSWQLGDHVTFNPGLYLTQLVLADGEWTPADLGSRGRRAAIGIGSVQMLGLDDRPLVQVHLTDVTSIDLHAALAYSFLTEEVAETYMFGMTWIW